MSRSRPPPSKGSSRRDPQLLRREFSRHLDSLETRLDGRSWLVGEAISIADVAVTAQLWQLLPEHTPWHAAEVARRTRLSAMMLALRDEAQRRASA